VGVVRGGGIGRESGLGRGRVCAAVEGRGGGGGEAIVCIECCSWMGEGSVDGAHLGFRRELLDTLHVVHSSHQHPTLVSSG